MSHRILDIGHYSISLFQSKGVYLGTECAKEADLKMGDDLLQVEVEKIFRQAVSAIKHCHNLDIVHQDRKPQFILRDTEGNVKVIDLPWPSSVQPTPYWNNSVWKRGLFLWSLMAERQMCELGCATLSPLGYYPFRRSTMKDMEEKIAMGTCDIQAHVSPQPENLIHHILPVPPEMRALHWRH